MVSFYFSSILQRFVVCIPPFCEVLIIIFLLNFHFIIT
nr:MAG TPA: hypothetical protein [Caudoviricetes sp.]